MSIISDNKYLISSDISGRVIVYDYCKHEEVRTLNLSGEITGLSDIHLMGNGDTIVIGDKKGLSTLNISDAMIAEKTLQQGHVNEINQLNSKDVKLDEVFSVCFKDGTVRLYRDH